MKKLDDLLEKMSDVSNEFEGEKIIMKEEEKKKVHEDVMKKINESKVVSIEDRKGKKASGFKRFSKIAVAAAIALVVLLASATTMAALNLNQSIKNFFLSFDEDSQKEVEKLVTTIDAKATVNDVTMSIPQVVGDSARLYIVLDIDHITQYDEIYKFGEIKFEVTDKNGKIYNCEMEEPQQGPISRDEDIVEMGLLVTGINDNGKDIDINGKQFKLSIKDIGYYDDNNKFIPLVEGTWNLEWTAKSKAVSKKIKVGKKININESEGIWKDVVVSPMSVTVHYDVTKEGKTEFTNEEKAKLEKTNRLVVQFTDGKRLDSRFSQDLNETVGTKDKEGHKSIGFEGITNTDRIESISFAGETIVLKKNVKLEERENIVSDVTKCTIAFPKKLVGDITLKEESDKLDEYYKIKRSSTTYNFKLEDKNMDLFTIYRYDGYISREQIDEDAPMEAYVGYDGEATYTIYYGEDGDDIFNDIFNKYVANILPYMEFTNIK